MVININFLCIFVLQLKKKIMKKVFLSALVISGLALTSCSSGTTEDASLEGEKVTYTVDAEATSLEWTGHYLVNEELHHSHTGLVKVSNGTITMSGDKFVEGSFTIDMLSMAEPNPENAEKGQYFISHMNSDDYFNTAEFPQSTFTLKSFDANGLSGTLSVIGINIDVDVPATVNMTENGLTATADFSLDIAVLSLPGLQIDPENPDQRVSPKVDFKLNLVMTK